VGIRYGLGTVGLSTLEDWQETRQHATLADLEERRWRSESFQSNLAKYMHLSESSFDPRDPFAALLPRQNSDASFHIRAKNYRDESIVVKEEEDEEKSENVVFVDTEIDDNDQLVGLSSSSSSSSLNRWLVLWDSSSRTHALRGIRFAASLNGFGDRLPASSTRSARSRLERSVRRFATQLERLTGVGVRARFTDESDSDNVFADDGDNASYGVVDVRIECDECQLTQAWYPSLDDDERYTLVVADQSVSIEVHSLHGAMHALQSTLLLAERIGGNRWALPRGELTDGPSHRWRGLLIDSARHFMPLDVLRRIVDSLAALKMNVLHWHLSDDQAWRVESALYPRLHRVGGDERFYAAAEVREFVEYAADRGVRVVPEIDVPGHASALLRAVGVEHMGMRAVDLMGAERYLFGVHSRGGACLPTDADVWRTIDAVLVEVASLFVDDYFHLGADEVDCVAWRRAGTRRAFLVHVADALTALGRRPIFWDEAFSLRMPAAVTLQNWRARSHIAKMVRSHAVLQSAGFYLDHMEPAARMLLVDPMAGATPDAPHVPDGAMHQFAMFAHNFLGGEAAMWSEHVSEANVESRILPRLMAVAERLWCHVPLADVDVAGHYARAAVLSHKLSVLGSMHERFQAAMVDRLTSGEQRTSRAVLTLLDVLEPRNRVGGSAELARPGSFYPLDRLADMVKPESLRARRFRIAVAATVAESSSSSSSSSSVHTLVAAAAYDGQERGCRALAIVAADLLEWSAPSTVAALEHAVAVLRMEWLGNALSLARELAAVASSAAGALENVLAGVVNKVPLRMPSSFEHANVESVHFAPRLVRAFAHLFDTLE
jgi:hexosaminidase